MNTLKNSNLSNKLKKIYKNNTRTIYDKIYPRISK